MKSTIDDVVDLERYPIASDGAARQAVVDACREQLRKKWRRTSPGVREPESGCFDGQGGSEAVR